jgi:hypothetical protein
MTPKPRSKPSSSDTAGAAIRAVGSYTKIDILSGRGGLANKHFGNRVFRRLVKHNKDLYRRLKSKRKQELLVQSILLAVEAHGARFLRENKASGSWYQIEEKDVRTKVCQALREPDRMSADGYDDTSEDGTLGSESSSSSSTSSAGQEAQKRDDVCERIAAAPSRLTPPRLFRQYTAENPPHADRRIFDRVLPEDALECDDEAEAIAPTLLGIGTSMFSLSGFASSGTGAGDPAQGRLSFRLTDCATLPPSQARYGYRNTSNLLGQSHADDCFDSNNKISPFLRTESAAWSRPPPASDRARLASLFSPGAELGKMAAGALSSTAAGTAATTNPCHPYQQHLARTGVPPPPLLRATSSCGTSASLFLGAEELALDRQESSMSLDFLSFVANAASV